MASVIAIAVVADSVIELGVIKERALGRVSAWLGGCDGRGARRSGRGGRVAAWESLCGGRVGS